MATTISLIRHGHVENPDDLYYGRLPGFVLSEMGSGQAEAARDYLQSVSLAAIFSSPQARAQQTAGIIGQAHPRLTIRTSDLIDEVHSPFDGTPRTVLEKRNWDLYSGAGAGYEQPTDVIRRVQRFLDQLRQQYDGQHCLAVTHGDLIAFTVLWAAGILPEVQHRAQLSSLGVSDGYPAPASISSLMYATAAATERPSVVYVRPY
jgi:broad specificity phosphatase PhoE